MVLATINLTFKINSNNWRFIGLMLMGNTKTVIKRNGIAEAFQVDKINRSVLRAGEGLEKVSISEVVLDAEIQVREGMSTSEIDDALILSAMSKIDRHPEYSYLASRLLLSTVYKEVLGTIRTDLDQQYQEVFVRNMMTLASHGLINPKVADLAPIAAKYLKVDRDKVFKFPGLQTIKDRYLLKLNGKIMETPQFWLMRVTIGLLLNEDYEDLETLIEEAYEMFSTLKSFPSTPTLFNSGSVHSQLSSCFLSTIDDSIDGIFGNMLHDQARLSKYAGGLGVDITPLRAANSYIKGTNGESNGLIPWVKCFDSMLCAVNQGGRRRGSGVVYLENWHSDYPSFLDLRRPTGEERLRAHDTNTANWLSDHFMELSEDQDADWYLFSPSDAPDLHNSWGEDFVERYKGYVRKAQNNEIPHKVMKAKDLWKEMLKALFETGHPWMVFKDAANHSNPQKHWGTINSSNLCISGSDRVVTDRGYLTAKELYIQGGNLTLFDNKNVVTASPMKLVEENVPVFKITLANGLTHTVTDYHQVVKFNKRIQVGPESLNITENIKVKDLNLGDKIAIQTNKGIFGKKNYVKEAFLLGLYQADGTTSGNSICYDVWEKDFDLLEEIKESHDELVDKYQKRVSGRVLVKTSFNKCQVRENSDLKVRLGSPMMRRALNFQKTVIPDWIWESNEETLWSYLRGLFYADGTVNICNSAGSPVYLSISNIHKEFLSQIQLILNNLGLQSSLSLMRDGAASLLPDTNGDLKEFQTKPLWRLVIGNKNSALEFERKTKFLSRKGKVLEDREYRDNTKKFYEVVSIENIGNEDVYCCTVNSEDHLWVVNGVITHNCTEIMEVTKPNKYDENGTLEEVGETAVCNLASINLPAFVTPREDKSTTPTLTEAISCINWLQLRKTIKLQRRLLDNVIDLNFYPIKAAKNSNLKHRPVGLGSMGWASLYFMLGVDYSSPLAADIAHVLQEFIAYWELSSNCDLAEERGAYLTFNGSDWSKGILPYEKYQTRLMDLGTPDPFRHVGLMIGESAWDNLARRVMDVGLRNSLGQAIAPTATISTICGVLPGIDPMFSVMYVYETMSGNAIITEETFVQEAEKLGIWGKDLVDAIKSVDGDLTQIPGLPEYVSNLWKPAKRQDQCNLLLCGAARQKFLDQAQSLNLFYDGKSLGDLNKMYRWGHKLGLKSTYYLRTVSPTKRDTMTEDRVSMLKQFQNKETPVAACRINDPTCESCQ